MFLSWYYCCFKRRNSNYIKVLLSTVRELSSAYRLTIRKPICPLSFRCSLSQTRRVKWKIEAFSDIYWSNWPKSMEKIRLKLWFLSNIVKCWLILSRWKLVRKRRRKSWSWPEWDSGKNRIRRRRVKKAVMTSQKVKEKELMTKLIWTLNSLWSSSKTLTIFSWNTIWIKNSSTSSKSREESQ